VALIAGAPPRPRPPLPSAAWLSILAPVAIVAHGLGHEGIAFIAALLTLAGGAFVLGEAAEVVARRIGEGLGSLLIATMSNMVTLVLVGAALLQGFYGIVRAAIVGAILGNLLLALGGAMMLGGLGRERQRFSMEAAGSNTSLLVLASFAVIIPTIVGGLSGQAGADRAASLSLPIAVVLLGAYFLGLVFSVRTHRHLFNFKPTGYSPVHEAPPWIERMPVILLVAGVALVAWMAVIVAEGIEPVALANGVPPNFLGIIVLGAVANSVEIVSAWRSAHRDRMNVAFQLVTGSGIQVMLFVLPVLVLVSAVLPSGVLSLTFPLTMAAAIGMATFLVHLVASDGESNWYEGALLLILYGILGVVFYVIP
jgi:Ca2+:H+ antiporter